MPDNQPRNVLKLTETRDGATLRLYGSVGDDFDGFSADEVRDALEGVQGPVTVQLNSPGGLVDEGMAIYAALREVPRGVTVQIDGLAASIASVIAMAGPVTMHPGAMMMIHNPWNMALGDANDMRQNAERLDRFRDSILAIYAQKANQEQSVIQQMMDDETWLTAEQAVAQGFADEITKTTAAAASVRFDLSCFQHPPMEVFQMSEENDQPTKDTQNKGGSEKSEEYKNAIAEERRRVDEIQQSAASAGLPLTFVNKLIRDGVPLDGPNGARAQIIDAWASQDTAPETRNHVRVNSQNQDFKSAAVDGILMRYGIKIENPHPAAQDFRGMSVKDLAHACIRQSGSTINSSKTEAVFNAAMTTSDFPGLMENVAHKALMNGFNEPESVTHRVWTSTGEINDLKEASRVAVSEAPELLELNEEGEIKHGSMSDAKETIKLETFARQLSLSRKAMINDDLGGLTTIPRALGLSAARKESDLVYNVLTSNPTMRDGNSLFDTANHSNLASSGSAPSVSALSEARAAMLKQKGLQGSAYLNIRPMFIICPVALEDDFNKIIADITPAQTSEVVPAWIRQLQVISDARLDDNSTTAWYLAASPNVHDTIEVARLDGDQPEFRQEESFDTAGMRWRVIADIGVAALDWRGLYKNPGA